MIGAFGECELDNCFTEALDTPDPREAAAMLKTSA